MNLNNLTRRPVSRSDWSLVRDWRNAPSVFLYMKANRILSLDEHMDWFDKRMPNRDSYPLLGYYVHEELLATTRIDPYENNSHEISIIVNPKYRKMGIALFCLEDTLNYITLTSKVRIKNIFATIHPENMASLRLFMKAGFTWTRFCNTGFCIYVKELSDKTNESIGNSEDV